LDIGVVITSFFCGPLLERAILSLRAQTQENWRCIVVHDPHEHGGDLSRAVEGDTRFHALGSAPLSVSAARNLGFGLVTGEYLFCLDGDDCIDPVYVERLSSMLERDQRVSIAHTGMRLSGLREGVVVTPPYSRRLMAVRNMIVNAAMFRRADFEAVGGYDENPANIFEDWELWIALLKRGGTVAFDPTPLFTYHQRPDSRSRNFTEAEARAGREFIFAKHRDFCWHSPGVSSPPP